MRWRNGKPEGPPIVTSPRQGVSKRASRTVVTAFSAALAATSPTLESLEHGSAHAQATTETRLYTRAEIDSLVNQIAKDVADRLNTVRDGDAPQGVSGLFPAAKVHKCLKDDINDFEKWERDLNNNLSDLRGIVSKRFNNAISHDEYLRRLNANEESRKILFNAILAIQSKVQLVTSPYYTGVCEDVTASR